MHPLANRLSQPLVALLPHASLLACPGCSVVQRPSVQFWFSFGLFWFSFGLFWLSSSMGIFAGPFPRAFCLLPPLLGKVRFRSCWCWLFRLPKCSNCCSAAATPRMSKPGWSFLSSACPLSTIKASRSAVLVFSILIDSISSARAFLKRAPKWLRVLGFWPESMTRSSHPHLYPFYQPHPDHQKRAGSQRARRGGDNACNALLGCEADRVAFGFKAQALL